MDEQTGTGNQSNSSMQLRAMTFGEKAVGVNFNPGGDQKVNFIKSVYAQIIDSMHELRTPEHNEKNRLISIAITEAQAAQMWAVKAITWKD